MKRSYRFLLLFGPVFLYCHFVEAQELKASKVPEAVRSQLKSRYPDVFVYEWEWKKKEKLYEAEFIINGITYEAYYTAEGEWVRTERGLTKSELPEAVLESLKRSSYADREIKDVEVHSTPKHERIYEVELKFKKQKIKLYWLPDGSRIE